MTSFQRKLMCIKRKQGHCKLLYKPHNKELKSLHVFVFDFSSKIILGRGCIFITFNRLVMERDSLLVS